MVDYKETCSITDNGPKLVFEATADWEDFLCFKYPASCSNCCVGWRTRCPVDISTQRESRNTRPEKCPLGLITVIVKD